MSKILTGDIFSAEFNEDKETFRKKAKRMVIVINQNSFDEYVYVVPLSSYRGRPNTSFRVIAEIPYINEKIRTVIMCDYLTKIHISKLHEKIGHVDFETIYSIHNGISKLLALHDKTDLANTCNKGYDNNIQTSQTEITKPELFKELLEKVDYIKNEVEIANKPINRWKERLIGFLLGIVSSIIASLIIA